MKCKNHSKKEARKVCIGCGDFFCDECLTEVNGKSYCKDCMADLISEKENSEKESKSVQPQVIINNQQQQQQQQESGKNDKANGSWCILCILLVVFFPAGIVYALVRSWN